MTILIDVSVQEDVSVVFFFQAEDGIRDYKVTGVQTCALPISRCGRCNSMPASAPCLGCGQFPLAPAAFSPAPPAEAHAAAQCIQVECCSCSEIGRASCRERV